MQRNRFFQLVCESKTFTTFPSNKNMWWQLLRNRKTLIGWFILLCFICVALGGKRRFVLNCMLFDSYLKFAGFSLTRPVYCCSAFPSSKCELMGLGKYFTFESLTWLAGPPYAEINLHIFASGETLLTKLGSIFDSPCPISSIPTVVGKLQGYPLYIRKLQWCPGSVINRRIDNHIHFGTSKLLNM